MTLELSNSATLKERALAGLVLAEALRVPDELQEFIDSGHDDLQDYLHEAADGDENVIYYAKAEELYRDATTEERDDAEQQVEDCGGFGEGKTMADRFTILAYWIVWGRLEKQIREQAETVAEKVREIVAELEEFADTLEELT